MRSTHALLTCLLLAAGTAGAFEVPTFALVEIVEGIEVTETAAMNFGVLARSNGTVTISPIDGSPTDPSFLIYDGAAISQGIFEVDSIAGATVDLACTAGAMPDGLALHDFMVEWAESGDQDPVPHVHTLTARLELLKLGASLTVTRADMPTPPGAVELPYTVEVTFQ